MKKNQDIWAGLAICIFALLMYIQTGLLSYMQSIYPKVLLFVMFFAGIGIIVRSIFVQKKTNEAYQGLTAKSLLLEAIIPGAFLIGMTLLVKYIGFYLDIFIVINGICLLQTLLIYGFNGIKPRKVLEDLIFAAIATGALYVLFALVLKLSTPIGLLGF